MKQSYYYTLLINHPGIDKWSIEFGDFNRETVEEERDITWREGEGVSLKDTKIIKTSELQSEIDNEVAKLNGEYYNLPDNQAIKINNQQNEIDELKEERDVLARENKAFAEYLERSGFSNDAITSIAFGSDEPELQCQSCEEIDYSSLEQLKKDKTEILNTLVEVYGTEYGLDKENLGSHELHSSDENVAYDIGYLEGITRVLKIVSES